MRAEWVVYPKHFNTEYCNNFLKSVLEEQPMEAKVGLKQEEVNDVRRSKLRFIHPDHPKLYYIFDHLWRLANHCNDAYFDFHITRLTGIQIAEYDSANRGEYKKHHDVFWFGNFREGDEKYHRKLSCVVQLSDPTTYEGGDLEFYELFDKYPSKEQLRDQGSCIFFPSFTNHAALPVTKGIRYSIAAWFEGPRWR